MCSQDDKKKSACTKTAVNRQSHKHGSTLPSSSRRRSRGGGGVKLSELTNPATASFGAASDSQQKAVWRTASSPFPRISARSIFLVIVSSLAWASLIVRLVGPAASREESVPLADSSSEIEKNTERAVILPGAESSKLAVVDTGTWERFTGWTPLGHHRRFLGEQAFPEQFKDWDVERPVVFNSVDVGPLAVGNETALPRADLLLAILSGDTEDALEKRDALREMYDKYDGWVSVGGKRTKGVNTEYLEYSFRAVFIVSSPSAPPDGELVGDILYVRAPDGYRNIVHKVKHMMGLVRHFSFKFLLKADDDTFVCVKRLATFLHDQPEDIKDKIYAGVGTVIKDSKDKWYDEKFVHHTLSGLDCFPVYMQGAFYVLAQPLVEHLYRGRGHYDTFINEDVTIGSWLLGVDRALAGIHNIITSRLWECVCGGNFVMRERTRKEQVFFHNCKSTIELRKCSKRLFRPFLAC